uniref:Uncharacterized protein n=1 Tax=Vitis vinifera TaxID=29760 RepID=F6I4Y9_VITVI
MRLEVTLKFQCGDLKGKHLGK